MGKQCRENDVIVKIVKTINVESFHQVKVKPLFYLSAYVSLNVPRLTTLDSNERERKFIVVKLWFVIFIGVDTKVSECVGSCVGAVFVLYHWLDLDLIPRLLAIFEIFKNLMNFLKIFNNLWVQSESSFFWNQIENDFLYFQNKTRIENVQWEKWKSSKCKFYQWLIIITHQTKWWVIFTVSILQRGYDSL